MPRAKHVTGKEQNTQTLSYPGEDEYNNPPDNLEEYMLCIYGVKGIGKTTAAASTPNSLTLMMEPKRKNLRIRQLSLQKYSAREIIDGAPDTFALVCNTTQQWIDDPSIKCLNYDSIDIFYEMCYHSVCASHSIEQPGDSKSGPDIWNEIRDTFASYFDTIRDTDMGINMLSHIKPREEKTLDGAKMGYQAPSCSPACLKYIQQAVDIVLYYGHYDNKRAMMIRDETNSSFVSAGVEGKFLQPDGKPVNIFEIPDNPSKVYSTIRDAFNNKLWDMDTPQDKRTSSTPKPIPKKGPPRR